MNEEVRKALSNLEGIFPDDNTAEKLMESGCEPVMVPIPSDFDQRLRYFGDLLSQMSLGIKGKDERLAIEIQTMAGALSYLLNSSSFAEGTYWDFDKRTIDKRIRRT